VGLICQSNVNTQWPCSLSMTKVRLYLFGIATNSHIHLQWKATNDSNKQQKFNHLKSNMSYENAEDDELYRVTIAAAVAAVTVRDHVPRWHNAIGWNKFASWIFFSMKINIIISLKQLWNCFRVLFLFHLRYMHVQLNTKIKLFYFSFISHVSTALIARKLFQLLLCIVSLQQILFWIVSLYWMLCCTA